jgi:hypothetical protein
MEQRRPRLDGKVAIVTGTGSSGPGIGTGKATSIRFAREGAKVLLVDRVASQADETLAIIHDEGGFCGYVLFQSKLPSVSISSPTADLSWKGSLPLSINSASVCQQSRHGCGFCPCSGKRFGQDHEVEASAELKAPGEQEDHTLRRLSDAEQSVL